MHYGILAALLLLAIENCDSAYDLTSLRAKRRP